MSATIIAIVHLTSYGFLHPGRERFKRVTKEAWPLIPGSTLYGAVAAALMRLDCHKEKAELEACAACQQSCGYRALLAEVQAQRLRFSPLVVTSRQDKEDNFYTAQDYSHDAAHAATRLAVSPRAPLNRDTAAIHQDRLHGLVVHQPWQHYRGFICCTAAFLQEHLKRALLALPFFPFGGGRGKFTQVEAAVIREYPDPAEFCPPRPVRRLALLTPAILAKPQLGDLFGGMTCEVANFLLRRYTFWRTGLYWEEDAAGLKEYGGSDIKDHLTLARVGLAETAALHFPDPDPNKLQQLFLHGLGAADFTCLGWGQVFFQEQMPWIVTR